MVMAGIHEGSVLISAPNLALILNPLLGAHLHMLLEEAGPQRLMSLKPMRLKAKKLDDSPLIPILRVKMVQIPISI